MWRLGIVALILISFYPVQAEKKLIPLYEIGNRNRGWNAANQPIREDYYLDHIQPLINSRCVACHACYEAPCQTNLQSYEGLRRGFNPEPLYSPKRFYSIHPTRMKDGRNPEQEPSLGSPKPLALWRDLDFLPVLSHSKETDANDQPGEANQSLFVKLIQQSQSANEVGFDVTQIIPLREHAEKNATPQCLATQAQFARKFADPSKNPWGVVEIDYFFNKKKNRFAGMPFGLPRLSIPESDALIDWARKGAQGPSDQASKALARTDGAWILQKWEDEFFNLDSPKARLSARYVYEHIYNAHIHFAEISGEFFALVRSSTRRGEPDEIVTELPYSSPGLAAGHWWYRFKKVTEAIVQKKHVVWEVNEKRFGHIKNLFLESDWGREPIEVGGYGNDNPFESFLRIPGMIRARFMIENAKPIVGAMVQGAVCVGDTATYAIRDHFWIWFLKPESDVSALTPKLGLASWETFATAPLAEEWLPTDEVGKLLKGELESVPVLNADHIGKIVHLLGMDDLEVERLVRFLTDHKVPTKRILAAIDNYFRTVQANHEYQKAYELSLRRWLKMQPRELKGLALSDLWNGKGDPSYGDGPTKSNPNAWLNVTRHEKSATVQYGSDGGLPQSIWVLSYSNFERLYYNLVPHFKEWGSIDHRLARWRIMSYIRLEAEDLAVSFLPVDLRKDVRATFTRGLGGIKNALFFPQHSTEGMWGPRVRFFHEYFAAREAGIKGIPSDTANEAIHWMVSRARELLADIASRYAESPVSVEQFRFESSLDLLTHKSEEEYEDHQYNKYVPNLAFVRIGGGANPWVYTLVNDRAYKSHNIVLAEDLVRDPKGDTLSYYRGTIGGYANVFFDVSMDDREKFLQRLRNVNSAESWKELLSDYGVAPNGDGFWDFYDWIHQWKFKRTPENDPNEQGILDLSQYDIFVKH